MREKYVPVSPVTANCYKLDELSARLDRTVELTAPYLRERFLMGLNKDVAKNFPYRETINISPLETGTGFVAARNEGAFQAQNVSRAENMPPYGTPVFWKPVGLLSVRLDQNGWNVEIDQDNVVKTFDLMFLVGALSNYTRITLTKQAELLETK